MITRFSAQHLSLWLAVHKLPNKVDYVLGVWGCSHQSSKELGPKPRVYPMADCPGGIL